jgi:Family of unknown function (DUF6518)
MPVLAILLGVLALGGLDALCQTVIPVSQWLPAMGAPWLIVSFLSASYARTRLQGAVSGTLVIAGGTAFYYALMILNFGGVVDTSVIALGWMFAAIPIGGVFGAAGYEWRSGRGFIGLSVLGAALLGEAALLALVWPSVTWAFLIAEAAIGVGVLVAAWSRRSTDHRWYSGVTVRVLFVCTLVLAMAGSEGAVREILRITGWGGL